MMRLRYASNRAGVPPKPETVPHPKFPWWRSFVIVIITLLTVLAVRSGRGLNRSSEPGVVMNLPDSLGGYLGFDDGITDAERRILPPDTEFAKKRYVGTFPSEVSCEIVLSGAQKNSIHRPQVCLTGQGWTILQEEPIQVQVAGKGTQRVRVLTLLRREQGRTTTGFFIYWFVGRNRTTDDHLERILYSSWDRFTQGVNHRWAYVIVSGVLPPGSDATSTTAQKVLKGLVDFTGELIPRIQKPEVFIQP